ncbi:MAG: zeta toxin family protein [Kiritimatiellae bacterium]|nr:zeta toxin family protein [Kiritimatiellia bacterium]
MKPKVHKPVCHVVAGPNGSGKSTFALRYLPDFAGSVEYVNPDLMAQGMSPTDIRLSAIKAGKLTLERIAQLISERASFAFETTLSGRGHLRLLSEAKAAGYQIAIYYLWMPEPAALPLRIGHRVLAGGHDVPTDDVMRRYARSRANVKGYAALADTLLVFDAVPTTQRLIYRCNGEETPIDRKLADAMRKDLGI